MVFEADAKKRIALLEEENRLLLGDLDIIYGRINELKTGQTQSKQLDKSQKKIKELNHLVKIQEIQKEFLLKTIELERKTNFEDELFELLTDYHDEKIDQSELIKKLESFHANRQLMNSAIDEQNFEILNELYLKDGAEALEEALDDDGFYGSLRADIYFYIGKKLRVADRNRALDFFYAAWEVNPVPNRCKDLAFAYWDADKTERAIACLGLLPEDYEFSSEEDSLLASTIKTAKLP